MIRYDDHTFAICAYGDSPYLEECIKSLKNQTVKSDIILATSTPSEYINEIAEKYDIPVFENPVKNGGIGEDWNFAVSSAKTNLVTVAHQDDVYLEKYLESILHAFDPDKRQILFYTNYSELIDGEVKENRRNLKVKRLISLMFNNKLLGAKKWFKRRLLSIGSPIGCPAVTLQTNYTGSSPYITGYSFALDWLTWEKLARIDGEFSFVDEIMMFHRRHDEAATTKCIENNVRKKEDLEVLKRFWCKPIALFIQKFFAKS